MAFAPDMPLALPDATRAIRRGRRVDEEARAREHREQPRPEGARRCDVFYAPGRGAGMKHGEPLHLSMNPPRWDRVASFVARWHGRPLALGDGYRESELRAAEKRLGFRLPVALREWYQLVGRRSDVTDNPDFAVPPDRLRVRDGVLVVYDEAQSVVGWGIDEAHLSDEDPPVVVERYEPDPRARTAEDCKRFPPRRGWIKQHDTLSEFFLAALVCKVTVTGGKPTYNGNLESKEAVSALKAAYPPLPFPAWHWPKHPSPFHGDRDTVIWFHGEWWAFVAARSREAWDRVESLVTPISTWIFSEAEHEH